jgi:hypothetical protein
MILNLHAEAHRAAASLIEQHPGITHVAVYDTHGTVTLAVQCLTDPDAVELGTHLLADVIRRASLNGSEWLTVEGGTFRTFGVYVTGPHRPATVGAVA